MLGFGPILLRNEKLSSQSHRKQGGPETVHDSIETKVIYNFKTCSSHKVNNILRTASICKQNSCDKKGASTTKNQQFYVACIVSSYHHNAHS
jgi:hypothetical protein